MKNITFKIDANDDQRVTLEQYRANISAAREAYSQTAKNYLAPMQQELSALQREQALKASGKHDGETASQLATVAGELSLIAPHLVSAEAALNDATRILSNATNGAAEFVRRAFGKELRERLEKMVVQALAAFQSSNRDIAYHVEVAQASDAYSELTQHLGFTARKTREAADSDAARFLHVLDDILAGRAFWDFAAGG